MVQRAMQEQWALDDITGAQGGFGVPESCHYQIFRLRPIPPPLARSKHPRWVYLYPRSGMYAEFLPRTVPEEAQR